MIRFRFVPTFLLAAGVWAQLPRDPAAWGGSHAGQPLPTFVTGDECLFCHRLNIGPGWAKDRHSLTIRPRDAATPAVAQALDARGLKTRPWVREIEFLIGGRNAARFLKADGYGKLSLNSAHFDPRSGEWKHEVKGEWDKEKFARKCAGCHTAGFDSTTGRFGAMSLDCFSCHGEVPLEHSTDTSKVLLSRKRRGDPAAIASLCGSCHIREGKSWSNNRPFPNNFVAGDNLFQDFTYEWLRAEDPRVNPTDRHITRNIRDTVLYGSDLNCLSCHDVHKRSTERHRRVLTQNICQDCHLPAGPKKIVRTFALDSTACEY
ncbi:MAG: hypothetical protein FJW40_02230 [Acidobacteria bacterium]|nr:hypothetical protein [Acidobacteriota bacterium]